MLTLWTWVVLTSAVAFATRALSMPNPVLRNAATNEPPYSVIIAFGDSLTDNGNGSWALTNHTWPANPNYYGGRFCNGPVWIEYVAGNLSVPLIDYAIGGATTSNDLVQGFTGPGGTVPVPSLADQVAQFLSSPAPSAASLARPLFVLLGGINDVFANPNITAAQSFGVLARLRAQLAAAHPRADVLALGYPALERIPYDTYAAPADKRALRAFSREISALWRDAAAASLSAHPGSGGRVAYAELRPLFADFEYYGAPADYGFAPLGAYGSCLTGAYGETPGVTLCADQDEMVYWDEYHPSTRAHSWMAKAALDALARAQ